MELVTRKRYWEDFKTELSNRGMIDVIRHGTNDRGVKLDWAYFKPNSSLNKELSELYDKNVLSITRQLKYSQKNENSVDMVIFLNGLPVIAIELKNEFTGQNVWNAVRQFRKDRDPKELLFQYKKRVLGVFCC